MKILIFFPHGIGDFFMCYEAFRLYKDQNNCSLDIACHSGLYQSQIIKNFNLFENIHWIHNPYELNSLEIGELVNKKELSVINKIFNYDKIIHVNFNQKKGENLLSRINLCIKQLKISNNNQIRDFNNIFFNKYIEREVDIYLKKKKIQKYDFTFIHLESSNIHRNISYKNLTNKFKNKEIILKRNTFNDKPLIFSILLLKYSSNCILVDSCFFHVCNNFLNKKIDILITTNNGLKHIGKLKVEIEKIIIVKKNKFLTPFLNREYKFQVISKNLIRIGNLKKHFDYKKFLNKEIKIFYERIKNILDTNQNFEFFVFSTNIQQEKFIRKYNWFFYLNDHNKLNFFQNANLYEDISKSFPINTKAKIKKILNFNQEITKNDDKIFYYETIFNINENLIFNKSKIQKSLNKLLIDFKL